MKKTIVCPVCSSEIIKHSFLSRENVPVHQNLLMSSEKEAREISRGALQLRICEECGFVFNQAFDFSKINYGDNYDNTQSHSPIFDKYISNLASYLIYEKGIQNSKIVEVGCGKGSFLRKLVEPEGVNNKGYGFDPSYVGLATDLSGNLKFENRYYDDNCTNVQADVVVCRHVIEHIPDPLNLLKTIKKALVNCPQARVFFETPCVEWILQNQVIWDFFYEHCSYFTAESLKTAFEVSGFNVESVRHVFEGQYLWLEATINHNEHLEVSKNPKMIPALAQQFARLEHKFIQNWLLKIQNLATKGKIAIWGAGAKGATFANLIDPDRKLIACVADINPKKQGRYLPGTGHPIVSYSDLVKYGVKLAIIMNPNYFQESLDLLQSENIDIELIY